MNTVLDLNDDFVEVGDGFEAVTVVRPGSSATNDVQHALRRALSVREAAASGGRYITGDVAWHLPSQELDVPPKIGDRIVDAAGHRWVILAIEQATLSSRWRCMSRNLTIAHGLNEFITIQRAGRTKGPSGAVTAAWEDQYTGLPARLQPQTGVIGAKHDVQQVRTTHKVFLAEDVAIDENQRVVDTDGAMYCVVGYERPERIDELMTLNVVAITKSAHESFA